MILVSRAEEIVLIAVWKCKENAYGVTIREQVYRDIGRYWAFGVIYKTLKKLRMNGCIDRTVSDPVSERGGRRKYYYRITPKGIEILKSISQVHASLWTGVELLSPDQ